MGKASSSTKEFRRLAAAARREDASSAHFRRGQSKLSKPVLDTNTMIKAAEAEETGEHLWHPGIDPISGEKITDLSGEIRMAKEWIKILGLKDVVIEGETRFVDILRRIFYAYVNIGAKMWNPYSQRFSDRWFLKLARSKTFKRNWTLHEGSEFLVKRDDFEPDYSTPQKPRRQKAKVKTPSRPKVWEVPQSANPSGIPTLLYRAEISKP